MILIPRKPCDLVKPLPERFPQGKAALISDKRILEYCDPLFCVWIMCSYCQRCVVKD